MATYKHKIIGRINGRYGCELREETRELPEVLILRDSNFPTYLTSSYRKASHRRGNPSL